ncbi:MAG TPA: thiamine pyrophosphate-dependent dehydrogenase E1 component subunit alpha [Anaerolineales bacterium]|nr:thiamine pyrophosphate-dependent dehydrogenase E1 component subunit alpha [Anaerolineales bacterium]
METNRDLFLQMYEDLVFGREFELCAENLANRGLVPGSLHLGIGEEATQVGACRALASQDYLVPSHRSHVADIVKGADPKRIMAEILGKSTGYCGGRAGSIHFADRNSNNLGVQGILGAVFPVAAGAALTQVRMGTGRIVLAFFGEGASHEGTFHEALNLSALWKLPLVWLCVNDLYAMGTRFDRTSAVANVADRASAYNMPGHIVDGNDVVAVYEAVSAARQVALAGNGPSLIECKTYRHGGHSTFDKNRYRPQEEIDAWIERDPIRFFEGQLRASGSLTGSLVAEIAKRVKERIEEVETFAVQSAEPTPESALERVFCESEEG